MAYQNDYSTFYYNNNNSYYYIIKKEMEFNRKDIYFKMTDDKIYLKMNENEFLSEDEMRI